MFKEFAIIFLLFTFTFAQNPCSSYWNYVRNDNSIEGILTLTLNPDLPKHDLKVVLSVSGELNNGYIGEIVLIKKNDAALRDTLVGIPVEYRVKLPKISPLPKLEAVYYDNSLYCIGQKEFGRVTTVNLQHSLTNRAQQVQNFQQFTQPPQITSRPFIQPTFNQNADAQCGVPEVKLSKTTGLVINGNVAQKGQFPWLVACYQSFNGQHMFSCGGSLISTKAVLTAAHCVYPKQGQLYNPQDSLFYFGRHNMKQQNSEYVTSSAQTFIVHPDWKPFEDTYDADIAIALLSRLIQFSRFIKPICLWRSNVVDDIVNRNGVIAGYGKITEESTSASDVPFWTYIPAVDHATCLRSNKAFSVTTSHRTFCIGNRNGVGACNGDSGGSFAFEANGKWYLRGIISYSILKDQNICDTNNYSVCTNVGDFYSWIMKYI